MNQVFTREGMRRLRGAWILLAASLAAAAILIGGTQAYLEKERRDAVGGNRRLQDARARVDNIRRERDSLEESAAIFRTMLDLVELMNELRRQHHIFSVDYEIAPQRPLALSGSRSFPSIEIAASRVTLRARALHEGDALAFIQALGESRQGFHPVDRCVMKRVDGATSGALQPRVEAECSLEWITMKEKRVA